MTIDIPDESYTSKLVQAVDSQYPTANSTLEEFLNGKNSIIQIDSSRGSFLQELATGLVYASVSGSNGYASHPFEGHSKSDVLDAIQLLTNYLRFEPNRLSIKIGKRVERLRTKEGGTFEYDTPRLELSSPMELVRPPKLLIDQIARSGVLRNRDFKGKLELLLDYGDNLGLSFALMAGIASGIPPATLIGEMANCYRRYNEPYANRFSMILPLLKAIHSKVFIQKDKKLIWDTEIIQQQSKLLIDTLSDLELDTRAVNEQYVHLQSSCLRYSRIARGVFQTKAELLIENAGNEVIRNLELREQIFSNVHTQIFSSKPLTVYFRDTPIDFLEEDYQNPRILTKYTSEAIIEHRNMIEA